jgi:hypothetical protein
MACKTTKQLMAFFTSTENKTNTVGILGFVLCPLVHDASWVHEYISINDGDHLPASAAAGS